MNYISTNYQQKTTGVFLSSLVALSGFAIGESADQSYNKKIMLPRTRFVVGGSLFLTGIYSIINLLIYKIYKIIYNIVKL